MANKAVQYLKHGKALCGKVFGSFVETFNLIVDFMVNLKGDADRKDGNGHITVDRTDPSHPIIRCDGCRLADGGDPGDEPEDPESPEQEDSVVTSLNDLTGDVTIIGGESISVTTDGKTIVIGYVEGKKPDQTGDPCEHPEGETGVPLDTGGLGGGSGGGGSGGGTPLDGGETHGNPCNDCT